MDYNYSDYKENLKIIYCYIINYLINEFCFEEIFIEFSKNNLNEEIYNIFKELDFTEKSILISKNQIKSNGGEDSSNNGQIKLNYLVYKNKNELDDSDKNPFLYFMEIIYFIFLIQSYYIIQKKNLI